MKSIAIFNNKGGVGKTTLLCNLASHLCINKKNKVLVIDADPQCNTTTYVLDEEQFLNVYYEPKCFTIADITPPLQSGVGYIDRYSAIQSKHFKFDCIPGNPCFAASEDFLASEWKDVRSADPRGIRSTLLFVQFLSLCQNYDYIFFDMGPSLGAINRSILIACDFFLTPMSSDVFSLLALDNIGQSISLWQSTFQKGVVELEPAQKATLRNYLDAANKIKFLGYVEQQYIAKSISGIPRVVRAYDHILKEIPGKIDKKIIQLVNKGVKNTTIDYKIGSIPNYYSLIPMSQTSHKPIFSLTNADGVVGAHYQKVKDFESLIDKVSTNMLRNMEALNE